MDTIENENENESQIYEIGFHIVPTVAEDKVSVETDTLKALVAKHDGEIISEGESKLQDLAYTIKKRIEGGYERYDRGYFGWSKFEMSIENIEAFKADVEELPNVLRFLIIKTVRENTLYGDSLVLIDEEQGDERPREKKPVVISAEEEKKENGEVSEEELDKKLDELVEENKEEKTEEK